MARSTVWWTCGVVARGIEVGSSARAGRERHSPRKNHGNDDVRTMDRSPCKKNDRRFIVHYRATAGPASARGDYPIRDGRLLEWRQCHDYPSTTMILTDSAFELDRS